MLRDAGLDPVLCAPGVDESAFSDENPERLALRLARAKAEAVAARYPSAWVLGADQVAWDGTEIFGKPRDPEDHLARLRSLRGRAHHLLTGFVLTGPEGHEEGVVRSTLTMRADLSDAELAAYVATGEGSGCAGGYAVEGQGSFLFERIEGHWFNIVGLPLFEVVGALRRRGWRFGSAL